MDKVPNIVRRWIEVNRVNRVNGAPNLSGKVAFWVEYSVKVYDDETVWVEHAGERLLTAVDELGIYREFPKEMQERHNITPNNVRWLMNQGDKNEGVR